MLYRSLLFALALAAAVVGQDKYWAFRAPARPEVPADSGAPHPVDAFVFQRLAEAGLEAAPQADDAALVRRLSLDLTGLPATPEDLAFLRAQPEAAAWDALVDRMLAKPGYAERWAAVWLDLARYADSKGYGSDPLRTIWRYRDWVIEAFGRNMRFDEFTVQQLAGDLLPGATWREQLPTAFHRNTKTNTEGGTDDEEFRVEAVRDRVDTTMQVWMGMTFGCAKCHDHKYEPYTQREYYEVFDVFNHTADADRGDDAPRIATPTDAQEGALREVDARIAGLQAQLDRATRGLSGGRRAWERVRSAQDAAWLVLAAGSLDADSAATSLRFDRRSGFVTAAGAAAERDRYEFVAERGTRTVRSLRLELATGPERETVGRPPGNGNVVVSELEVLIRRAGPAPERGRFVRIDLPGPERILSLAEVEVRDVDGANVAVTGTASQSSVDYGGPAALAIDGDHSGSFEDGSVTHTRTESDPWWEVDLGRERSVRGLTIWNRTGGDLERRLEGLVVTILDGGRAVVWSSALEGVPDPGMVIDLAVDPQRRRAARASASFEQDDWEVAKAWDGDEKTGWAVSPWQGRPQHAVWTFEPPLRLDADGDDLLSVVISQQYGGHHVLQRFRLSTHEGDVPALPFEVADALAIPEGDRTDEQRAAIDAEYATLDPTLAALRVEIEGAERARRQLDVVETPVLVELPPERHRESFVLRRGNFLAKGDRVHAAVPASLHPAPDGVALDRLAFARWLCDRRNPLTARVQVNRLWARIFGVGLVATEEDFGSQGARPTHQELLDWLAVEFMDSGWDVQHVLKTIVTSAAYRRSAIATARQLAVDPQNLLLARGPRVRLEAEMVRDQALAFAGLLSEKRYGPSVFPPQPDGLWQAAFNGADRRWETSTGEDRYRRAVYTFVRRSSPYPAMTSFDAPTREICTPRRIRTNTPLQAFVTLNDPVFVECAQALARRIVREGGAGVEQRVGWALRTLLLRDDLDREAGVLEALYVDAHDHWAQRGEDARAFATDPLGPLADRDDPVEFAAWTAVANVLLNLDAVLTKP